MGNICAYLDCAAHQFHTWQRKMPLEVYIPFWSMICDWPLTLVPWPALTYSFFFGLYVLPFLCSQHVSCSAEINFTWGRSAFWKCDLWFNLDLGALNINHFWPAFSVLCTTLISYLSGINATSSRWVLWGLDHHISCFLSSLVPHLHVLYQCVVPLLFKCCGQTSHQMHHSCSSAYRWGPVHGEPRTPY